MKMKFIIYILITAAGFIFCNRNASFADPEGPVRKGEIDLSVGSKFSGAVGQTAVILDGEWEFYRNRFIGVSEIRREKSSEKHYRTVPDNWNCNGNSNDDGLYREGFGTYHIRGRRE